MYASPLVVRMERKDIELPNLLTDNEGVGLSRRLLSHHPSYHWHPEGPFDMQLSTGCAVAAVREIWERA